MNAYKDTKERKKERKKEIQLYGMIKSVITAYIDKVIHIYVYTINAKLLVVFRVTVPCLYDRRFGYSYNLHIHRQRGWASCTNL
jgi:hypothetical protein